MTEKRRIEITSSEAKVGKNCLFEYDVKYRRGLAPKVTQRPLKLGSWVHTCLEYYYQDMGWEEALKDLIRNEWDVLFDEEKEMLGDLPQATRMIMEGYEFRYKDEPWELVIPPESKFEIEMETRNFIIVFKGRIDLVVRDKLGQIWCVDHKTSKRFPNIDTYRALDPQLTLYPWALQKQYGIKANGALYNYLRTKAPTKPKLLKRGGLSVQWANGKLHSTPLVFARTLRELGLDPKAHMEEYRAVVNDQAYFFLRARVPRDPIATSNIIKDLATQAVYLHTFTTPTRNITQRCEQCRTVDLCMAELYGLDTTDILRGFQKIDPYAYLGFEDEVEDDSPEDLALVEN